jgi:hypothetical protein
VVIPEEVSAAEEITEAPSVADSQGSDEKKQKYGAAAVGAVIGTVVFGPIVGVVCAGSAFYAASRSEGKIADTAKAGTINSSLCFDNTYQ